MKKLFDIFLTLGTIIILLIAVLISQPNNFYIFLHWYIFLGSIYLIYRAKDVVGDYGIRFGVIFFCAIAIIFNPFIPFAFSKKTWRIIDLILIVISVYILFLSIEDYKDSLSQKGKIIFKLIKFCFWNFALLFFIIWVFFYKIGDPYHDFLLITKATTANGFIIGSREQEDDGEHDGIGYQSFYVYYVYTFTTKDGKTIKDNASERSPESGYLAEANVKPIPIEVEYIPSNPKINRIKGMTTQPTTIWGLIWRFGLLVFFLIITYFGGIDDFRNTIKSYLREINETRNEDTIADKE